MGFASPKHRVIGHPGCRSGGSPFQACLQGRVMGSLHCARICMDVIAALIGRRRGRPAPCLAPPASETPLRAAPPPGTQRRGYGGGAGPGSCTPQTAGRRRGPGARAGVEGAQSAGGGLAGSRLASWKTRGWRLPGCERMWLGSRDRERFCLGQGPADRSEKRQGSRRSGKDAEKPSKKPRSFILCLQPHLLPFRLAP